MSYSVQSIVLYGVSSVDEGQSPEGTQSGQSESRRSGKESITPRICDLLSAQQSTFHIIPSVIFHTGELLQAQAVTVFEYLLSIQFANSSKQL